MKPLKKYVDNDKPFCVIAFSVEKEKTEALTGAMPKDLAERNAARFSINRQFKKSHKEFDIAPFPWKPEEMK